MKNFIDGSGERGTGLLFALIASAVVAAVAFSMSDPRDCST